MPNKTPHSDDNQQLVDLTDENLEGDEINAERGPQKTIQVTIGDQTYRLRRNDAAELQHEIKATNDLISGDITSEPILKIARKRHTYNTNDNPWHLKSEYGCRHHDTVSTHTEDLNLVELALEPVYNQRLNYWSHGQRATPLSFNQYFDLFFCSHCEDTVQFWHTQRQIFLPELADQLSIDEITQDSFNTYDIHQSACDTCGTPKSGISELDINASVYGINGPFMLCPTCRDLLVESESELMVSRRGLSAHPHNKHGVEPESPVTDPDFDQYRNDNQETEKEDILEPLDNLSFTAFIRIIKEFEGVTDKTAQKLYNNGYRSIPELANASYSELEQISLVGRGTAKHITTGAQECIERYMDEVEPPSTTDPEEVLL